MVRPDPPLAPATADVVLAGEVVDEAPDSDRDPEVVPDGVRVGLEVIEAEVVDDGAEPVEGVAVEEAWVEVREAGVVEPRKVQTSSGPRGI